MTPPFPSADDLLTALIAFVDIYVRRYRELSNQLSRQEMAAYLIGHFSPRRLADLVEAEMVGHRHVTPTAIETIPGREGIVAALRLIDSLLVAAEGATTARRFSASCRQRGEIHER